MAIYSEGELMIPSQVHHLQAFQKVGTHRLHACHGGLIRAISFFQPFFARLSSGLQLATLISTHCSFVFTRSGYFVVLFVGKMVCCTSLSPQMTKLVDFVAVAITVMIGLFTIWKFTVAQIFKFVKAGYNLLDV
jgi:hypothetical protein